MAAWTNTLPDDEALALRVYVNDNEVSKRQKSVYGRRKTVFRMMDQLNDTSRRKDRLRCQGLRSAGVFTHFSEC
jgi:hypothetical protein